MARVAPQRNSNAMGAWISLTRGKRRTADTMQVNVIMDSFASLALATEPPTDNLLLRPPRAKNESIITRKMMRFIIGSAALQLYVVISLMYGAQLMPWFRLPSVVHDWTGALS